jgi:eukaryotic-like serine/threonine-protein kinase
MIVGDVLADRYELEELVGSGGMSSVYRARDRTLDRTVALKVLALQYTDDADHIERFSREARTVASLSHPNIVTLIDRGEHEGRRFIVFEYVEGDNLKRRIQKAGPAPVDEALRLVIQVARGLSYAHAQGLVHRDVKPQNVLLNGHGQAKVTDFGIARATDVQGVTQTGTVLGSSEYISPEQAQGREVDERTDVYSLGVVLYELLTGSVPFTGENFVAVAMRHINEPAPSVLERRPDVPLRVADAVDRALAKEPADRFPTMSAFGSELAACLDDLRSADSAQTAVLAPPDRFAPVAAPPPAPPRRRRRVFVPVLLLVAGFAVLGVVLGFALWPDSGGGGGGGGASGGGGGGGSTPVALRGVGAWDPDGDGHEHDAQAPLATDGNPATYWETEHYRNAPSLNKPGVGLVLAADGTVDLHHLTVQTGTPGFAATIEAGDSATGPFRTVSDSKTVSDSTTFDLHDAKARFFVVWITSLGSGYSTAQVNEVTASG